MVKNGQVGCFTIIPREGITILDMLYLENQDSGATDLWEFLWSVLNLYEAYMYLRVEKFVK
jgi:hypothetical protein